MGHAQSLPNEGGPTRIAKEEVKRRMEAGEPIVFLDTRSPGAWNSSDRMLPGARRVAADDVENHLSEIPGNHPIVTYCT